MSVGPYPEGFFDRMDEGDDARFYAQPRLVTHIDDRAINAVGALYADLGLDGELLDLMSSWISHLTSRPRHLTVLGMNAVELEANPMADDHVVHDLNTDPTLPFDDERYDGAMCCVSVDYLTKPVEVFAEVARVLRPGAPFVCTFSNRCFPTKAIQAWNATDDATHCAIVASYFEHAGGFEPAQVEERLPSIGGDPLWAVWARRR